jgi:DNA-directed RNA polymerase specialized sigma24 family protein/CheY-like chemotaxis protein
MVPGMEPVAAGERSILTSFPEIHGFSLASSDAVVKYVPFVRRYARALTGTQSAGDAYVAATLEAWLEVPPRLEGRNPRVELFELFTKIWRSVALNKAGETSDGAPVAERRLQNLTPQPRQAFLLVTMEGFSETETAQILNCDVLTARNLVEQCGRELAEELATNVLIIEDEVLIALDLETIITSLGHRVIGVARTHAEAIELAHANNPGLILSDIQLADGSSGLEAVKELMHSFDAPVIFITAYPEHFLTGERPEPAFLVSKPFERAAVSALVSQALFFAPGRKSGACPA